MMLWQYVLGADNDLDLVDGARALAWLKATDYFPQFSEWRGGPRCEPPPGCWTDAHVEFFRANLLALRSLGARLKGFKSREPRGKELAADKALMDYVRYLRYEVAQKGRGGSHFAPRPLDRRNFDGLKVVTERPEDAEGWLVGRWQGLDVHQEFVLLELDMFFASAFLSMVMEGLQPICGRCGQTLEPTPTGRKPRAKFCKACQFKAWEESQTPEEKRKRWREGKRRQREEN